MWKELYFCLFMIQMLLTDAMNRKRQILRLPLNLTPLLWAAWFPAFLGKLLCPGHQMVQFCRIYISFFVTILRQFREDMPEVVVWAQIVQLCCFWNTVNKSAGSGTFCCVMDIKFFLPIQKVRIARSEAELSIGISPSVRNIFKYFSWWITKFSPCPVLDFGGTAHSAACCFAHAKKSSTNGFILVCRCVRRSVAGSSFRSVSIR